jgi:pimeloyl-ACP methyl ester carboxylesterase
MPWLVLPLLLIGALAGITRLEARRLEPLLLITGDADDVVPAWNHAERLVQQAPLAEPVRLPGIGHWLHHVATERIASLIEELARRAAPDPTGPRRPAEGGNKQ